jgi:hypothetical protein
VGEIRPQSPSGSHIQATAKQRFTSWNFVVNHVTLYHTRHQMDSSFDSEDSIKCCREETVASAVQANCIRHQVFHTKQQGNKTVVYTFSVVMNPFCVVSAVLRWLADRSRVWRTSNTQGLLLRMNAKCKTQDADE